MTDTVIIRECETLAELTACVELQREVFRLPDVELSPVRHFVVTKNAGGFALGAFDGAELVGFVLSVPAFLRGRRAFYSHMAAVTAAAQGRGIGARLKWAQRERALADDVRWIKWTFEPVRARNAFFNLEKLGAVVREYRQNFYGTDYGRAGNGRPADNIDSDRVFAEWDLLSESVNELAAGRDLGAPTPESAAETISVPPDWAVVLAESPKQAAAELLRVRREFEQSFARRLVCRRFDRGGSRYLLFAE